MSPRQSRHIDRRQVSNFFGAVQAAETLGRPLNTFVTLNFDHTTCEPMYVSGAFEKLRDNHFTRWLRYQSRRSRRSNYGPPTYAWVIEHKGGDTHVHWMAHIPASLKKAFETKLPQWLAAVAGVVRCESSAIKVKPIDRLLGLGRYFMKGIDPRHAPAYHVRSVPQGVVYGKRCGISKCLGPTARARPDLRRVA